MNYILEKKSENAQGWLFSRGARGKVQMIVDTLKTP